MTQTWALLVDAYRDLNSRKIFWIVLILSALVAGAFAAVGIDAKGVSILVWRLPISINTTMVPAATFYKQMFLSLGVGVWLTGWLATGLALISTASIFPDFIAGGTIDLFLSKPIGRLRLFLTKYITGLLFVALQIGCFCLASLLVIGIRGGAWEPGIFLAVPIVVLFYSYLYCMCVLIGVLTRSAIAAITLTLLFWLIVFAVHSAEVGLLTMQIAEAQRTERLDDEIASLQASLAKQQNIAATEPSTRSSAAQSRVQSIQDDLDATKMERSHITGSFDRPHAILYAVKTVLPKTSETVDLLQRELIKRADLKGLEGAQDDSSDERPNRMNSRQTARQLQEKLRNRSVAWVVGTSLGFEAAILALAAWVFCRRDY